ncbi:MAG TPA: hypothetical protein VGH73_17840 [Thermoanaerobaculia bacterium]|jgi:hypothetical protein
MELFGPRARNEDPMTDQVAEESQEVDKGNQGLLAFRTDDAEKNTFKKKQSVGRTFIVRRQIHNKTLKDVPDRKLLAAFRDETRKPSVPESSGRIPHV